MGLQPNTQLLTQPHTSGIFYHLIFYQWYPSHQPFPIPLPKDSESLCHSLHATPSASSLPQFLCSLPVLYCGLITAIWNMPFNAPHSPRIPPNKAKSSSLTTIDQTSHTSIIYWPTRSRKIQSKKWPLPFCLQTNHNTRSSRLMPIIPNLAKSKAFSKPHTIILAFQSNTFP